MDRLVGDLRPRVVPVTQTQVPDDLFGRPLLRQQGQRRLPPTGTVALAGWIRVRQSGSGSAGTFGRLPDTYRAWN